MNDHEVIENLDLLLNLDIVVDSEDAELIENLQEMGSPEEPEDGGKDE